MSEREYASLDVHSMTQEELKHFLKANNLSPKFDLGQNFLMNEDVLDLMVETADVKKGDTIIEVGPGIGNLSGRLAERGAKVLAIEKDSDFKKILQKITDQNINFQYVIGDALKINFFEELEKLAWQGRVKVVANIPYYLTGALMKKITAQGEKFFSITILVQKEVAQNLTARPGKLNLAGVALQLKAETKFVEEVPARDFYPAPKVDSAIVHALIYHPQKYKVDEKLFFKILHAAFLGKRKQIHNTLKNNLSLTSEFVEKILHESKIDFNARPQQLSIEDWIRLYDKIKNSSQKK